MIVPHQPLTRDGPDVSPDVSLFALGSWHTYDRMDFDEVVALLVRAVDVGINLFDVGVYGRYPQKFPLSNPRTGRIWTDVVFAHAMRQAGIARGSYLMAEKVWLWAYPRLSIEAQLDHALLRQGTDYVDILMLGDMEDDFDLGVLVSEVAELIQAGKTRWWGVNNWSVRELKTADEYAKAHGLPRPQLAQLKYNVARRTKPESDGWIDFFAESGVALQASDIFESGYFAGKSEVERGVARDPGDIRPMIQAAAPRYAALARSLGVTPAQLSIAFCLTHPATRNVLFGATTRVQLEENLGALAFFEERKEEIRGIVDEFWFDRGRVDPAASWAAMPMEFAPHAR